MPDQSQMEALQRRIADERRRTILVAAETDTLPPNKLLERLANLDGAAEAIQAMLDEGGDLNKASSG